MGEIDRRLEMGKLCNGNGKNSQNKEEGIMDYDKVVDVKKIKIKRANKIF